MSPTVRVNKADILDRLLVEVRMARELSAAEDERSKRLQAIVADFRKLKAKP